VSNNPKKISDDFRAEIPKHCRRTIEVSGLLAEYSGAHDIVIDPATVRNLNHQKEWEYLYTYRKYNFLLMDGSLLAFKLRDPSNISFTFLGCPYSFPEDMESQEIGIIMDQESVDNPAYVRFDYAPSSYRKAIHPAAHMHLYRESPVRLGVCSIIGPLAFTQFILRQFYPHQWNDTKHLMPSSSPKTTRIPASEWAREDSEELHLHTRIRGIHCT
tara:strand:- start:7688 stop:8332 length:645 start_codon:yes stop_codon:yes gene_type:complete